MKKILIFAPLGSWMVHHQLDAVVGAALRLRGCDVRAICCDGLFEQCFIAGNPFNPSLCKNCARHGANLFSGFQLPVLQLRSLLSDADLRAAREWAQSVPMTEFFQAAFEGMPIGQWVALALNGFFKTSAPNFSTPDVAMMARSLLYNGVLILQGYRNLRANYQPDYVFCYNGSHAYYRVFFELCRRDGIDVLVHERGAIDDSFILFHNCTGYRTSSDSFEKAKQKWLKVPLTKKQWSKVHQLMNEREVGKNTNFFSFINFRSNDAAIKRSLRIPTDAPVVTLFGSSDWEIGMLKSYGGVSATFDSQEEWMRDTAQICAEAGYYLIIRHHPLLAGTASYPRASDFLREVFRINRTLGKNVRVIMPAERISSYDLIWNSDAAVNSFSTIGGESLVRGLATVCVGDSFLKEMGMIWVQDKREYSQAIEKAVTRTRDFGSADLRQAYRFAHFRYFVVNSHRFRSFGIKNVYHADIRIRSIDDLAEGNDPTLDRVINHILAGADLYKLPADDFDENVEQRLIDEELDLIKKHRAQIRQFAGSSCPPSEVALQVVRIRQNGVRSFDATLLHQSLQRSRWRKYELAQIAAPIATGQTSFLEALDDAADRANSEFVYLATDWIQVDEAAFSTALDLLMGSDLGDKDGVVWGVYWCNAQGDLTDELFTELQGPVGFTETVLRMPALEHPASLLSLVMWRTAALRRFVATCRASDLFTPRQIAVALYHLLFCKQTRFHKLEVPMVILYAPKSREEMLRDGIEALKNDKADLALCAFEGARAMALSTPGLSYARAVAKVKLGRWLEARLCAEAEVFENPDHHEAWALLRQILSNLLQQRSEFALVASAIDSVEGYLLHGQVEYLFRKVRSLPHDAVILEIGGYYGRSTIAMAFACAGTQRRIFTIDTFCGNDGAMGRSESFLDVWRANLSQFDLEHYVAPLSGRSHEQLAQWNGRPLVDFVFLDASQEYADVHRDFEMVYPLVREGGWVAFHDVEPGWPGPWRVWRQTARQLLGSHEYCSSLACGQKEARRQFQAFSESGYSYGQDWAEYLQTVFPQLRLLTDAMLLTAQIYYHASLNPSCSEVSAIKPAETIIGQMPEVLKKTLRDMLSKEAATDGLLHYWNALALRQEDQFEGAAEELKITRKLCETGFRVRVDALLNDNRS